MFVPPVLDPKQRKVMLWLTMPVVVAFIAAIIFAKIAGPANATLIGPGPNGESCSTQSSNAYNLQNTIRPGEIGFQVSIGCNFAANFSDTLCFQQWNGAYWLNFGMGACSGKHNYNAVGSAITVWYSCAGGLASQPVYQYRGEATFHVQFNDGYVMTPNLVEHTPYIFTRCISPQAVESY